MQEERPIAFEEESEALASVDGANTEVVENHVKRFLERIAHLDDEQKRKLMIEMNKQLSQGLVPVLASDALKLEHPDWNRKKRRVALAELKRKKRKGKR